MGFDTVSVARLDCGLPLHHQRNQVIRKSMFIKDY